MSAIRIVMVLWAGLFFVLGPLMPPGDGDLWWQRWLGEAILRTHGLPNALGPETFSAAGAPWVPQEWLLSLIVALSMDHGFFVVVKLLAAAIPVVILLTIIYRSRWRCGPEAIAIVLVFAGMSLEGSFGVRAQVMGWGCFALFLLCLDRRDGWYYLAIPVVALWANLHASAMLAPVFLATRVLGDTLDNGWRSLPGNRDARILVFVILAVLCTPLGLRLPEYALALAGSPIRHYIQEWQPTGLSDTEFLFGAFPIALLIALGGVRLAWQKKAEGLPLVMLFAAMLLARRNVPLFAIAAAPLAAQSLALRFPGVARLSARTDGLQRFAIVATCVALAFTAAVFALERRVAPPTVPVAAIALLASDGEPKRLFCEDFSSCSIALQYPNVRVYMDGRCDPFPLPVWNSYISTIRVRPTWENTLKAYGVDSVVASASGRFAKALARDRSWRPVYHDAAFVLYERT